MTVNHEQLWAKCQEFILDNIGADNFNAWFRDIISVSYKNDELELFVPSNLYVEYIEDKFIKVLGTAIHKFFGPTTRLRYSFNVKADDPESCMRVASSGQSQEILRQTLKAKPSNPFVSGEADDIASQLNPKYTLENYCSSDSNKIAYSIAESIANTPSIKTFNPFFVFGSTGVGKTHLIQGIGIRIKEQNPRARVLYVSARLFESQYTTALLKGQTNKFFNFYQSIDTLIVDDIQELQNKGKTQNTFFNIFNHLHLNNKQIILSSDRAPAEMEGFEARLLGRFKWGMSVALEKPDRELRRMVLMQKAAQNGVALPADIVEYICDNVTESIRDLEGVLCSMLAHAMVLSSPLTLDIAKTVVANAVQINRKQINFEMIVRAVSAYYDIQEDALFTKSRKREISDARQMIMYLAKKHTDLPLISIGNRLARSHSTVIYGITHVEERLLVERSFQSEVEKIEATLV